MATTETEVRKRHRDEGDGENEVSAVVQEDSEPAPEGADYWDLDDDDQWGPDSSSSYSKSEVARKRKVLRRSTLEVGIAFACHVFLMCYYIYVHVYDATIVKRSKGVGFDLSYGGRWKFLTYLNLVS